MFDIQAFAHQFVHAHFRRSRKNFTLAETIQSLASTGRTVEDALAECGVCEKYALRDACSRELFGDGDILKPELAAYFHE